MKIVRETDRRIFDYCVEEDFRRKDYLVKISSMKTLPIFFTVSSASEVMGSSFFGFSTTSTPISRMPQQDCNLHFHVRPDY